MRKTILGRRVREKGRNRDIRKIMKREELKGKQL